MPQSWKNASTPFIHPSQTPLPLATTATFWEYARQRGIEVAVLILGTAFQVTDESSHTLTPICKLPVHSFTSQPTCPSLHA